MKFFLIKSIIFIIAITPILFFPAAVLMYGKEYLSTKEVVQIQKKDPRVLYGFAYTAESFYSYKKLLVQENNPEIISLGTSRVMQFRKEFFTATTTFINAGGAGKSFETIESFIDTLPQTSHVKVIFLGLDDEVVILPYKSKEIVKEKITPVRFTQIVISMGRRIYLDYFSHKFSINELIQRGNSTPHIGISAIIHGGGFRSDGSYCYGVPMPDVDRLKNVNGQVKLDVKKLREDHVEHTKIISQNSKILLRILEKAKKRNIIIIGFLPPLHPKLYEIRKNNSDHILILKNLKKVFDDVEMPFFDLSDINLYDSVDTEFVDSIHGTDLMYMKIIRYMASHITTLNPYVNLNFLNKSIKSSKGDFLNF